MTNRFFILVAVLTAAVAVAEAPAKPNGIKIGDGRLHPFLTVRAGYDSAAGLFPVTPMGTTYAILGDLVVTPNAGAVFNLDTGSTAVNFNGSAGYVWYTGVVTSTARDLSYFTTNVGLDTAFNKTGAVEVQIGDQFARSNQSGNVAAGIGVLALHNSAYLRLPIHPGGGALTITPSVRWDVEFFSPQLPSASPGCTTMGMVNITCDPFRVNLMDYSNVNFGLNGKWKFLPKTAVVLDGQFDYRWYWRTSPVAPTGGVASTASNLNAQLLRIVAGLSGLITSRISTLLLVGGAGDFGSRPLGTFIAQAEVAWLGQDLTARGGFIRTLNPVPVYGIFGQNRGYLEVKTTFFGRLGLRGFGAFDHIDFYNSGGRADYIVSATAEVSFQFVSIFSAALQYNLAVRISSSNQQTVNYQRHEPALTLTLSY